MPAGGGNRKTLLQQQTEYTVRDPSTHAARQVCVFSAIACYVGEVHDMTDRLSYMLDFLGECAHAHGFAVACNPGKY